MLKLYSLKILRNRMTRVILFLMAILLAQQIRAQPNVDSSRPVIRFFSPLSGRTGTTVAIHGVHFTGAVDVSFGGVSVDSFTVAADSLIHAIVGNGASGAVRVTTPSGTDTACCFTYLRDTLPPDSFPPDITRFSPQSARTGSLVSIFGRHFKGALGVGFGGVPAASFTVVADTLIRAIVGNGASGAVRVSTRFGTDSLGGFTYLRDTFPPDSFPPDITSFNPTSGRTGTVVNIFGKYFHKVTGVSFGGVPAASYTNLSDSLIRATVGTGASGAVRVTTIFGTDSLGGFTYIRDTLPPDSFPPDIITFNPKIGRTGTVVNILGTHFKNTVSVSFGGVSAASFSVLSDSLISATVGKGASGAVRVATPFGIDSLGGFVYIRDTFPPDIITFNPKFGRTGTVVNIFGSHFSGAVGVSFGGVSASSFTVLSDSLISATVGNGASGAVRVSTPFGTDSLGGFTFIRDTFPPDIITFNPKIGTTGTTVNIFGTHFRNTISVSFGGVPAASFSVSSDSLIRAIVGNGASGSVRVSTTTGTDSLGGFTYIRDSLPPDIITFNPKIGRTGTVVDIFGTHFNGAVGVSFGGVSAPAFTVLSDSLIRAIVGNGATGVVRITTPFGTDTLGGFIFTRDTLPPDSFPPDIISFNPTIGRAGTVVNIFGAHFRNTVNVSFGGVPAFAFAVVGDSLIRAEVGNGASGAVRVTSPFGTDSLGGFTFIKDTFPPDSFPPDIITFNPTVGRTGTVVNILGTRFTNTIGVSFGGVPAFTFTVVSDSLIRATVGNGTSGAVRVTTIFGTDSLGGFTFIRDSFPPNITAFTPTTGRRGTVVNIFGTHFRNTTGVSFGGVPASFTVLTDSLIRAVVGNGASGAVRVTTIAGTDSLGGFVFVRDTFPPNIITFNPTTGRRGTVVNIFGTHLGRTVGVSFGGVPAGSFTVISDSLVRAVVGNGASGAVRITSIFGTDSLGGFTFISDSLPPNIITFNPTTGRRGTVVNIFGTHLGRTVGVSFGGVPAASFSVVSDSLIRAVVGNGASGAVRVTSIFGTDSLGGFTFISDSLPPNIITFTPKTGTTGTVVTINGAGFTGTTSVSFGGIPAATYTILSDSIIKAVVDTGATGVIKIRTFAGSDTMGTFTYFQPYSQVRAITVAPNPATAYTIVTHPAISGNAQLKLSDITGNVLRTRKISPNVSQTRFNLSGINPGVYKLAYSDGGKRYSVTLLIQ